LNPQQRNYPLFPTASFLAIGLISRLSYKTEKEVKKGYSLNIYLPLQTFMHFFLVSL